MELRRVRDLAVAELHVVAAAQRCGGLAHIDGDGLAAAGAEFPQIGGGEAGRGQGRRAGHADAERRRQDRVGVAGEVHRGGAIGGDPGGGQDRAQGVVRHGRSSRIAWVAGGSLPGFPAVRKWVWISVRRRKVATTIERLLTELFLELNDVPGLLPRKHSTTWIGRGGASQSPSGKMRTALRGWMRNADACSCDRTGKA